MVIEFAFENVRAENWFLFELKRSGIIAACDIYESLHLVVHNVRILMSESGKRSSLSAIDFLSRLLPGYKYVAYKVCNINRNLRSISIAYHDVSFKEIIN